MARRMQGGHGRPSDHDFSRVPSVSIERSVFARDHAYKTTFDAGYLIPFLVDEVLPGDTFRVQATMFARLATPIWALMDNVYLDVFYFFVPNRLLWTNWVRFMGEQDNPADSISFLVPVVTDPVVTVGSLGDYMGLPFQSAGVDVCALPFRAYNLIWNQWFRDENLQNSVTVPLTDGPDAAGTYTLLRRGKRHDYFTSALPWPQKGAVPVSIPLGSTAPVKAFDQVTGLGMLTPGDAVTQRTLDVGVTNVVGLTGAAPGAVRNVTLDNSKSGTAGGLYADLSTATSATINALRQAFQVQKLLERDARGGTRYTEIVQAHFKVKSPDARLQRAEYLGGGTIPVIVQPVAAHNVAQAVSPYKLYASVGGFGVANGGVGFSKSFTEHGVLLGLFMARADLTYQRGIGKMWFRRTRYDFYWPEFAHLGEQAVLNKEIFANNDGNDDLVFGYQERWAEYRYFPSMITGQFRSNAPGGDLDDWHLAIDFSALPALNAAFIQEDPPLDRVIAVPADPHFRLDSWIQMKCARPMPTYSVPGLVDHL